MNRATSPVHARACIVVEFATMQARAFYEAPNRKGCPEVAERKAPDPLVQVRGSKTLDFNYSHSFTHVCCGVIPVGSSLVVSFDRFVAESRRASPRRRLRQILDKTANYFETASPQFHFCPRDKNELVLRLGTARNGCQNGWSSSLAPV